MPQALPYIGAATGLFGVLQASKQADMAQQGINLQKKSEYYPNLAKKQIYETASKYDPAKEAQAAANAAQESGAAMLSTAMSGNKAKFSAMGGTPGGDTAFSLKQLSTVKNYVDPVKMFVANLLANATQNKMNALSQVFNGGTASPAAQMMFASGQNADFASPLALFSQSMSKMPWANKSGGSNASTGYYTRPGSFIPGAT